MRQPLVGTVLVHLPSEVDPASQRNIEIFGPEDCLRQEIIPIRQQLLGRLIELQPAAEGLVFRLDGEQLLLQLGDDGLLDVLEVVQDERFGQVLVDLDQTGVEGVAEIALDCLDWKQAF